MKDLNKKPEHPQEAPSKKVEKQKSPGRQRKRTKRKRTPEEAKQLKEFFGELSSALTNDHERTVDLEPILAKRPDCISFDEVMKLILKHTKHL